MSHSGKRSSDCIFGLDDDCYSSSDEEELFTRASQPSLNKRPKLAENDGVDDTILEHLNDDVELKQDIIVRQEEQVLLPVMTAQPNDNFTHLTKYSLTIVDSDIRNLFSDFMNTRKEFKRDFMVIFNHGIFGSFFTLIRILPDDANYQNKLDIVETEQNRQQRIFNADIKKRKAFEKVAKKFKMDCAKVAASFAGVTSKRFEIIIPAFACDHMFTTWDAFTHPFDASSVIPDFVYKPKDDLLYVRKSGSNKQNAVFGHNHLFQTTLLKRNNEFFVKVAANLSALERFLVATNNNFNSLPCADYLRAHINYKIGKNFRLSVECHNKVVENKTWLQHYHPEVPEEFLTLALLEKMSQSFNNCIKLDLYDYQKQAVKWMMAVESRRINPKVFYHAELEAPNNNLLDDIVNREIITSDRSTLNPHYMPYKGGLLADEMGLGKTVEVLALVVANPSQRNVNERVFNSDDGASDTTAIFDSRATLVIAPNHLVIPVWKHIFAQSVRAHAIITITTKYDFSKITVQQLKSADLVIISAEFFESDSHLHTKDARLDGVSMGFSQACDRTRFYCKKLAKTLTQLNGKTVLNLTNIPLQLFHWHRLVVDESQYLLSISTLVPLILNLACTHSWCVSGTAFPTFQVVLNTCRLLGLLSDIDDDTSNYSSADEKAVVLESYHKWLELLVTASCRMSALPKTLMWRSTKQGVATQITIPSMVEYIHVLDFTPTERVLYTRALNAGHMNAMRELCCHVRLSEEDEQIMNGDLSNKTLDEISAILIQSRQSQLTKVQTEHEENSTRVKRKQEKLDRYLMSEQNVNDQVLGQKLASIEKLTELVKIMEHTIETISREIAYFESALAIRTSIRFDETIGKNVLVNHACPICMEEVIVTPALTSCGHLFCSACVQKCKEAQSKCPVCRKSIAGPLDILNVAINDREVRAETKDLVNKYGTKMGNLIQHLREMWIKAADEKMIIFSSHNSDLERLGKFLAMEDIKTVFCKGNVHARNKAFAQFNDPSANVRVMMLSLEKGAAGSNLTAASEIILLDSIWEGSFAQQVATELQALNRAHRVGQTKKVRIVRMLIRDTIETERFKQQYPDFDTSQSLVVRDLDQNFGPRLASN